MKKEYKNLSLKEKILKLKNRKEALSSTAKTLARLKKKFAWKGKTEIAEIKKTDREAELKGVRDAFNKPVVKKEEITQPQVSVIKINKWGFSPFKSTKKIKPSTVTPTQAKPTQAKQEDKSSNKIDYNKFKTIGKYKSMDEKFKDIMSKNLKRSDELPDEFKKWKLKWNYITKFNRKKNSDAMNPVVSDTINDIVKWFKKWPNKKQK